MKKISLYLAVLLCITFCTCTAHAYWIWTPDTKKFINPKYAVKDSPKEQFEWAMRFYDSKNYQRAATEFEKLVKNYEYSDFAGKSQYYAGLSYERMGKYFTAFQNYAKAVDNFPHIDNMDEIIEREYHIGNMYLVKSNPKILGADIMTSLDRAIEIYRKVVEHAPFGKYSDLSLFNLGEALKRAERYDESIDAYQRIVDEHPTSKLADRAKYEAAYCAYRASLKPDYDSAPTNKAIQSFEEFAATNNDEELTKEASVTIQRLKDKVAEKSFSTAQFYERQKKYKAALVYYQDVVDRVPDCSFVEKVKLKIEELKRKVK